MALHKIAVGVGAVVTAAVVALVVLTGSSGDGEASGDDAKTPMPAGVYAYMTVDFGESWEETTTELIVADGTERVGRAPISLLGTSPLFTSDGRYAFTLTLGDEIVVMSAKTGKVTTAPCDGCSDRNLECQCQTVVPFGGSEVAWLGRGNRLTTLDLGAGPRGRPGEPRTLDATVPVADGFLDEKIKPTLIAGTDGAALAAYPPAGLPGDDLHPAYVVTAGAEPRKLDPDRPDSIDAAAFSPDGTQVALTGDQEDTCATVTVADIASGKGETTPVHAEPGTKCDAVDVFIDSLWWDEDGTLNVYFQASDDAPGAEDGQRRLDGGAWVAPARNAADETHRLRGGATVTRDGWKLYVRDGGKRTRIDGGVRHVTVAPR
jgi:hypothetical protein